jgi:ssDNA thymidine ADP-ribosyltransferase, DarT
VDNLPVILQRGGLHAPNHVPDDGLVYRTIHNVDIQNVRQIRRIPLGLCGTIHDYVPFYFGPRSPMLYQLYTGWVSGYNEGQSPLIYLVSTVQAVDKAGLSWVFSDGHGIAHFTSWFDDLADLTNVDWDAVYTRVWRDTVDDMDRQRRKQAEFLVHEFCPWEVIQGIGVISTPVQARVEAILRRFDAGKHRVVHIRGEWYY